MRIYEVVYLEPRSRTGVAPIAFGQDMQEACNRKAADGWHLVAVVPNVTSGSTGLLTQAIPTTTGIWLYFEKES